MKDSTRQRILSNDLSPWTAYEIGCEEVAFASLRRLIECMLDVVELGELWRWGDGAGGGLHDMIDRAAIERGLPTVHISERARRSEVQLIAERDGWSCHYCGVVLVGSPQVPFPHVEHKHAKARGGSDRLDNKVLSCPVCNSKKGVTHHDDFPHRCPDEVVPFR